MIAENLKKSVVGDFEIESSSQSVTRLLDGKAIKLSKSEILIVKQLAENPGVTVSRDALLERCWAGKVVTHSSLTVAIKNIRSAFASIGEDNIIVTEPKKGYSLRLSSSHYQAPEALDVEQNNELFEDVLPASKHTHIGKYLSVFTKEFGLQLVFFLLTIFACSQYFFFVEETTLKNVDIYYDGGPIPSSIKASLNDLPGNIPQLVLYPLGGLCPNYQVIAMTEDGIEDFTSQIRQGDCDD